jgi:AcrR family transcriptional regulator
MPPPSKQPKHSPTRPEGRVAATRRRGATLENALLDAAWDELQSTGYAKLTMERIAERAGTSRAVIYRRWRNRPQFVIAALRHHQPVAAAGVPDTGTLRGYVHDQLLRGGTEVMTIVLERAAARGEARADVCPRVAVVPLDLVRHKLILTPHPPSRATIEEIVDQVFLPLVLRTP